MNEDQALCFTVWRDVDTDAPRALDTVLTDLGFAYRDVTGRWYESGDDVRELRPNPTAWCDPRPPVKGNVTLADLRRVHDLCWEATLLSDEERGSLHDLLAVIEAVSGPS